MKLSGSSSNVPARIRSAQPPLTGIITTTLSCYRYSYTPPTNPSIAQIHSPAPTKPAPIRPIPKPVARSRRKKGQGPEAPPPPNRVPRSHPVLHRHDEAEESQRGVVDVIIVGRAGLFTSYHEMKPINFSSSPRIPYAARDFFIAGVYFRRYRHAGTLCGYRNTTSPCTWAPWGTLLSPNPPRKPSRWVLCMSVVRTRFLFPPLARFLASALVHGNGSKLLRRGEAKSALAKVDALVL